MGEPALVGLLCGLGQQPIVQHMPILSNVEQRVELGCPPPRLLECCINHGKSNAASIELVLGMLTLNLLLKKLRKEHEGSVALGMGAFGERDDEWIGDLGRVRVIKDLPLHIPYHELLTGAYYILNRSQFQPGNVYLGTGRGNWRIEWGNSVT